MTSPEHTSGKTTTPDRTRLKSLFAAVCDLPTIERRAMLDQLGATDTERDALEPLLAADDATDRTSTPARELARPVIAMLKSPNPRAPEIDRCDQTMGVWTIEEKIGEGGMGVVYRARRSDGQFQQTAAIKFLTGIATPGAVQRLTDERATLAALEHPNIARLLDGGTTPEGTPYLAMDFVKGSSIIEYCRTRLSSVREVAALMIPVCDAVSYAHQTLTLHCDLKPANIMVDNAGRPKLLDFGIAELIGRVGAGDTASADAAFTPRYSSPEQRAGLKLSTATDIYSLGRVLADLVDEAFSRSNARHVSRPAPRGLTGVREARAIVARASARTPAARYDSVAAMRADLERLLAHEPVAAMDGGMLYPLTKLLARRWGMATALSVLVVGGIAFTHSLVRERDRALKAEARAAIELTRAQTAEDTARAERDRAQVSELRASERADEARLAREAALADRDRAVRADRVSQAEAMRAMRAEALAQVETSNTREARDFLYSLFDGADPHRGGRSEASAADMLARGRDRIRKLSAEQQELKSSMLMVLARIHENIGMVADARKLYQELIEFESLPVGGRPAVHADALGRLAVLEHNAAQMSTALSLAETGLAIRKRLFASDSLEVADAQNTMGLALSGVGRDAEATAILLASLATRQHVRGEKSEEVSSTLHNLGLHHARNARPVEAELYYRQSLVIKNELFGRRHPKVLNTLERFGALLSLQRRFDEAEPLILEAYRTRIELHGPESIHVAVATNELGSLLHDMGRYREAETRYLEALNNPAHAPDADGRRSTPYAIVINNLATLYEETGNLRDAEKWYRASLEVRRARLGLQDLSVARTEHNLGRLMAKFGTPAAFAEAQTLLDHAYLVRSTRQGVRHSDSYDSAVALAELALQRGKPDEARARLAALDATLLGQRVSRELTRRRVEALLAEAGAVGPEATGAAGIAAREAALTLWQTRAQLAAERLGPTHLTTLRAVLDHADALLRAGDAARATSLMRPLIAPFGAALAANAPERERITELSRRTGLAAGENISAR